jgi:tRNA G26 N,N-dimethylase Trm1
MKSEYCHESALRLVLHTLATSAARYGRYITPLLSLSIDFYVRVFVRIDTSPMETKRVLTWVPSLALLVSILMELCQKKLHNLFVQFMSKLLRTASGSGCGEETRKVGTRQLPVQDANEHRS